MAEIIRLKDFIDKRGILTVLDSEIKFKVKRVYYMYKLNGERGGHRHKKTTQALITISGSCKIFTNNGKIRKTFFLNKKNKCLILKPNDWHLMNNFSKDCILFVLCSEKYKKNDYIYTPYKN